MPISSGVLYHGEARRPYRYVAIVVVAVLAGCAGRQAGEPVNTPVPVSSVVTDAHLLATGNEFAQCLTDHGVIDFPRPIVHDGRLAWPDDATTNRAIRALGDTTAHRACRFIIDPMPATRMWTATTPSPDAQPAEPAPSPGCGRPAPASAGTSTKHEVTSAGLTRSYLLHLPRGYVPASATPVVLAFHGGTSRPAPTILEQMEQETGLSALADQRAFIVVYPRSTTTGEGVTGWNIGGKDNPTVDDVGFVNDVLDQLDASLCVDKRRIYATGFSSGGGLIGLLACRSAVRIAAFAAVSGAFFTTSAPCNPSRPVPILEFHGTSDKVPYAGGPFGLDTLQPIPRWLQDWADRDQCTRGPTTFFTMIDIVAESWSRCRNMSTVIGYRIINGQHLWPGAAGATQTVNATTLIWSFFEHHRSP
jgi:polyhydroxybutyrate depolymerase